MSVLGCSTPALQHATVWSQCPLLRLKMKYLLNVQVNYSLQETAATSYSGLALFKSIVLLHHQHKVLNNAEFRHEGAHACRRPPATLCQSCEGKPSNDLCCACCAQKGWGLKFLCYLLTSPVNLHVFRWSVSWVHLRLRRKLVKGCMHDDIPIPLDT